MISVRFYGRLKEDFGGRFLLDARSPREALHALFVQLDGLRSAVEQGFYKVKWRGRRVCADEAEAVLSEAGAGRLDIVPAAAGAGKAGTIIAGVVLVVIGVIGNIYGGWGTPFIQAGIGLIAGGVVQLLTRQPKLDTERHGVEAGRNSSFSNLDNTAAQGRPVPVAVGLVYCGSRVVSQGVESRRLTDADRQPKEAVFLGMNKDFTDVVPMPSAAGGSFASDAADDSVRARNYTAQITEDE